ncbi:hypothetical protein ACEZDB_12280 [Streptacidiphilus sp. N1-3]|uniref:Peptidase inhibitor family I36 n=1 Tax=Streptacidiphilus alkalitolerans TaxID=3342712 RepID=A0ABV6WZE6_9ACTN
MRKLSLKSRTAVAMAMGGVIAATSLCTATSASATVTVSTNCNWALGLDIFYNSNQGGASADLCDDVYDYAGWPIYNGSSLDTTHPVFTHEWKDNSTAGVGVAVKNNAASVINFAPSVNYTVYYHSGYSGAAQSIPYVHNGAYVNLIAALKNNNASQRAFAA